MKKFDFVCCRHQSSIHSAMNMLYSIGMAADEAVCEAHDCTSDCTPEDQKEINHRLVDTFSRVSKLAAELKNELRKAVNTQTRQPVDRDPNSTVVTYCEPEIMGGKPIRSVIYRH